MCVESHCKGKAGKSIKTELQRSESGNHIPLETVSVMRQGCQQLEYKWFPLSDQAYRYKYKDSFSEQISWVFSSLL